MQIWSVSEVNRHVRRTLEEDAYLRDLWVEGEVSNLSVAMSGHAYFTLKDAGSQLRCMIFRQQLQRIRRRPENGERCVAQGALRVYEPQGVYQLYATFLAPAGLGELQLRLEELRLRLESEGLFDPSRKRPLPAYPRRIGVVTSRTGAVIHDIQNVLARRWPLATIVLAPTLVQGAEAIPLICQAIDDLNHDGDVEVIIVARGGGSAEDLAAFNDEKVARAIFASHTPIVSAIGHETDVTIADLVADQRAPTPSAAAEMIAPDLREVSERLTEYARAFRWHTARRLDQARLDLDQVTRQLEQQAPSGLIRHRRTEIQYLSGRLKAMVTHHLQLCEQDLNARALQLAALDPLAILRRGFSVTYRVDSGKAVASVAEVSPRVRLRTRVADGTFDTVVAE